MKSTRRRWLPLLAASGLLFAIGPSTASAKEDHCEGDRKQRKQKMAKRDLGDARIEAMCAEYKTRIAAERERMTETVARRLSVEYEAHRTTGAPFVFDVLIISGGGAKGAFGAGFLEGWGEIPDGPFARPEFDMVTGVSTGALLAPFAFVGTEAAYAAAAGFYANPHHDWAKTRGLLPFLPKHASLVNTCHLQDTIREAIDQAMIEAIADGATEGRLLLIGATNLDIGIGRVFDLGEAAQRAVETNTRGQVASIVTASSSIPGVFPPIEVDGMLYADGGATSNLFIATFPGPDGALARFLAAHPGATAPPVRLWVLINQQLRPLHEVVQPRWISVAGRALNTLTSTSQIFALALLRDLVHEGKEERGLDAELRVVSIPEDAPENESANMFEISYMRALQSLGRRMGADPSSWADHIPTVYWLEEVFIKSGLPTDSQSRSTKADR